MTEPASTKLLPVAVAERACSRIQSTVTRFVEKSRVLNEKTTSHLPQLDRNELVLGSLLGFGGFSQCYEVSSIDLQLYASSFSDDSSTDLSTTSSSHSMNDLSSEQQDARAKLAERALSKRKGKSKYAVKHVQAKFLDNPSKFKDAGADLVLEAHFLAALNHPNILSIQAWALGGSQAYSGGRHDGFFIVLERLNETLEQRIKQWDKQLKRYKAPMMEKIAGKVGTEQFLYSGRLQVARDIASALSYLHDNNIIYRDLKPSNVGFTVDGTLKLFDFGLARELPSDTFEIDEVFEMSGRVGTTRYMDTIVCKCQPYNLKSDVYSFTIVLWEILQLQKPFKTYSRAMHRAYVVNNGERPEIDSSWPMGIQKALKRGWSPYISDRPTMKQFLAILVDEISDLRSSSSIAASVMPRAPTSSRRIKWKVALLNDTPSSPSTGQHKNFSQRSTDTTETFADDRSISAQ